MSHALVIHVRFYDGRYHGAGDWPPSPARLFQALVAAAGLNGQLAAVRDALDWLQRLPAPPLVGAPKARPGQGVLFYMPNNDLDTVQGDPRRAAKIRTAKKIFHPQLFDAAIPFLYLWQDLTDADEPHARKIISLANSLYQLGRGVDMAWAWGELLSTSRVADLLTDYKGVTYRPSPRGGGKKTFQCPHPASLASLETRYGAFRQRFDIEPRGRSVRIAFRQPPRPSFCSVAYESPPSRLLYELRTTSSDSSLASWPLVRASNLVVLLRDAAVDRLQKALPGREHEIARVLIGRKPDGTNDGPSAERVRIVPLPSIGHVHADCAVRRVLVEVPPGCSLRPDDLAWAFSGLEPIDAATGNLLPLALTPSPAGHMLRHYGVGDPMNAYSWRTVIPAVLPMPATGHLISPALNASNAKSGAARVQEQQRAAMAFMQALRHADVHSRVESILVQREPFEANGERANYFSPGTRFSHRRLWHVAVRFAEPISGLLVIGDGRFLGLGVMAPGSFNNERG